MIDISAFLTERERLRRFCFRQTRAVIVIRDVTSGILGAEGRDPVSKLAEWLLFLLAVDAKRFVDPDDPCDDFGPSIFAYPSSDTKQDVATIVAASSGNEAIVIDHRLGELILPIFAPHLVQTSKLKFVKDWDRSLRKHDRVCAIVSRDPAISNIAIEYGGGRFLSRRGGETFDLAGGFWRDCHIEIARQPCVSREEWRRKEFQTEGNA